MLVGFLFNDSASDIQDTFFEWADWMKMVRLILAIGPGKRIKVKAQWSSNDIVVKKIFVELVDFKLNANKFDILREFDLLLIEAYTLIV